MAEAFAAAAAAARACKASSSAGDGAEASVSTPNHARACERLRDGWPTIAITQAREPTGSKAERRSSERPREGGLRESLEKKHNEKTTLMLVVLRMLTCTYTRMYHRHECSLTRHPFLSRACVCGWVAGGWYVRRARVTIAIAFCIVWRWLHSASHVTIAFCIV